jgi:hypothetical protein
MAADPITVMSTISLGLKLVDQFRDLALRFMNETVRPPSATAAQVDDTFEIRHQGNVTQQISAEEMHLTEWDEVRVRSLERRVRINWSLFNELDAEVPLLATDERVRIELRMGKIKDELCEDFREMVRIFENTLGTGLPDHYTLYEVCSA